MHYPCQQHLDRKTLSEVGSVLTFRRWENSEPELASNRTRTHTQVSLTVPTGFHTIYCEQRWIRQNLTVNTPPPSLGLDALRARRQIKLSYRAASQHKTHSEAKRKVKRWASPPPIVLSHPEGYFQDLSSQMNSGRRNTPLCNVRGQATMGRERRAAKTYIHLWHFEYFSLLMAYTFMIGISRDGDSNLQRSQASIHWLAKPERNKIQKKRRCQKRCRGLGGRQRKAESRGWTADFPRLFLYGMFTPETRRGLQRLESQIRPGDAPGRRRGPHPSARDAGSAGTRPCAQGRTGL